MEQVKDVVQGKSITLTSLQARLDVVKPGSIEEAEIIASDPMSAGTWTAADMAVQTARVGVAAVRTVFRGQMVTAAAVKVGEAVVEVASAIGVRFGEEGLQEASAVHASMYRDAEAVVSTIKGVADKQRNGILLASRSKVSNLRSFWARFLYGMAHDSVGTLKALSPSMRKVSKKGVAGNTESFDGRRKLLDVILDDGIAKGDPKYRALLQNIEDAQRALNEARQTQHEAREKALKPFGIAKVEPMENAVVGADLAEILAEM